MVLVLIIKAKSAAIVFFDFLPSSTIICLIVVNSSTSHLKTSELQHKRHWSDEGAPLLPVAAGVALIELTVVHLPAGAWLEKEKHCQIYAWIVQHLTHRSFQRKIQNRTCHKVPDLGSNVRFFCIYNVFFYQFSILHIYSMLDIFPTCCINFIGCFYTW